MACFARGLNPFLKAIRINPCFHHRKHFHALPTNYLSYYLSLTCELKRLKWSCQDSTPQSLHQTIAVVQLVQKDDNLNSMQSENSAGNTSSNNDWVSLSPFLRITYAGPYDSSRSTKDTSIDNPLKKNGGLDWSRVSSSILTIFNTGTNETIALEEGNSNTTP